MNTAEFYQELQEQLLEETLAGVVDNNYYDDSCTICVEVDYTTQDWLSVYSIKKRSGWPMVTLNELSQHRLIINLSSVILPLLTRTRPMWDEIQDMPGEIFDVPDIETVLVEDEDGNVGVDLSDINNWPWQLLTQCKTTSSTVMNSKTT